MLKLTEHKLTPLESLDLFVNLTTTAMDLADNELKSLISPSDARVLHEIMSRANNKARKLHGKADAAKALLELFGQ